MKLLELSEFSHCKNPITARASFYLDSYIEDVAEEFGYCATSHPCSNKIENGVCVINFNDYSKKINKLFVIVENGEIFAISKHEYKKTGNQIFNDDIQILDEVEEIIELEKDCCGIIEDFISSCENLGRFENIACQAINVIEESLFYNA